MLFKALQCLGTYFFSRLSGQIVKRERECALLSNHRSVYRVVQQKICQWTFTSISGVNPFTDFYTLFNNFLQTNCCFH